MTVAASIGSEAAAREFVASLGDATAIERLDALAALVLAENRRQNLIAKPTEDQIWARHIADSAQLLRHVPRETLPSASAGPWLDLGSGPGFPGLVIAALRPDWPVMLVESRALRTDFLARSVETLGLCSCRVVHDRLERVAPFPASVISARAFAPLAKLLTLSAPFSTSATVYVLPKGRSAAQELAGLKPSIRRMFHVEQSLTDAEAGIIVRR